MDENKKVIRLGRSPEEKVPEFYVNQVNMIVSIYEVLLQFGLKTNPEQDAQSVANIRMSPQHAKVMTLLLLKNLRSYEKDIGAIKLPADMAKDMGIEEKL